MPRGGAARVWRQAPGRAGHADRFGALAGVAAPARDGVGPHALIYDFGGFPDELYRIQYPSPGDPGLAARMRACCWPAIRTPPSIRCAASITEHGWWRGWPGRSETPVLEVSMPFLDPPQLFQLGRALRPLRDDGVLVVGSGGIVHNLSRVRFATRTRRWTNGRRSSTRGWRNGWRNARSGSSTSTPVGSARATVGATTEHFDPLFVAMGASWPDDSLETIYAGFHYGNLSMRSFCLG